MQAHSHIAFGLFSGAVLASFFVNHEVQFGINALTAQCATATIMGALAPDIDNEYSALGKCVPVLARAVSRRFPHRTLLHSICGLCAVCAIVYGSLVLASFWLSFSPLFCTAFFACAYCSHLVLDTLTKRGVRYFYPLLRNPFGYPSFEGDRIRSGDKRWELLISVTSLLLFVLYLPVTRQGANASLGNAIGSLSALQEVYLHTVDRELVLHFEGVRTSDKAPVKARALILKAEQNYFLVHMNGEVHRVGEGRAEIHFLKGRSAYLPVKPAQTYYNYRNEPLADILSDMRGRILISGHLEAGEPFEVRKPYNERTVSLAARTLWFSFASKADIEALNVTLKADIRTPDRLEQDKDAASAVLDSLLFLRHKTRDLYRRDSLYAVAQIQRKKIEKIRQLIEEQQRHPTRLLFSGRLTVRRLPDY